MGIRIDYDVEQEVDVTARFEIYDEEPDSIRAEYPSDILELMDHSNISMAEVIADAVSNGVEMPDSDKPTFDMVMAFLASGDADAGQLMRLIDVSANELLRHIRMVEKTNQALRETIDRVSEPDQKTA